VYVVPEANVSTAVIMPKQNITCSPRLSEVLCKRLLDAATFGMLTVTGLMTGCVFPTTPTTQVYESKGVMYRNPVFSIDGSSILVQSQSDLLLFRPDGSLIANLIEGVGTNADARWSPDGRWIIFWSDRDGQKDICRIRPDGADFTNLTKTADDDEDNVVYSPDGEKIVFHRCRKQGDECGGGQLVIANADGTGQRIFANDGWEAWWSPDNRWIAYIDVRGNGIWIQSPDGGGKRKLVDGKPISWTPDGTAIFYRPPRRGFDKNADVRRINIDGSGDRLVLKDYSVDEWWGGDPQRFWDPSGLLLALVAYREIGVRDGGVVIVDRDGNVVSDFREQGDGFDYYKTASWSPDGNLVLFRKQEFFSRAGGAYLVNVRTGRLRQVIADDVQIIRKQP
jgi:Tol biopolymer transport system component